MLKPADLMFMDETAEDPAELLKAFPVAEYEVLAQDDDLGLRSLFEHPEAFRHPFWRDQARRSGSGTRARPGPARAT